MTNSADPLQKPTDLDQHCLQRQGISGSAEPGLMWPSIYGNWILLQVKVNGEDLLEYEQKLSMKTINCIRIENDVELTQVKLK